MSCSAAAQRAAEKHGFTAPSKQAVKKCADREGWQRKASLSGINQAAHRIADAMVESDGSEVAEKVAADNAKKEQDERSESERKCAEVRARHRHYGRYASNTPSR